MKKKSAEAGMLVVEATILFPVMFLIIFLMMFLGNAYMQKCRVEAVINKLALDGAAYCACPMLYKMDTGEKKIPDFATVDIQPYRYLIGGMSDVVSWIDGQADNYLSNVDTGFYLGMKPKNWVVDVNFKNQFICSSLSIDVKYDITVPIRLLGMSDYLSLKVASHSEVAVSDTTEFVRNVNMVEDYLESTGIKEKLDEGLQKIKDMMSKVTEWK